jgi:hypothetical protein
VTSTSTADAHARAPHALTRARGSAFLLDGHPLHFTFPSGGLRYQCAGCDAPCCKGVPLLLSRSRELAMVQAAQPRASLLVAPQPSRGGMLTILPPERCWFLSSGLTCRLEQAVSRDAKPAGCRLFPFSRLVRAGENVVILPDMLCPLRVGRIDREENSTATIFSHASLARELVSTHMPAHGHPQLQEPEDCTWDDAMHIERRIVADADAYLERDDFLGFIEMQQAFTASHLGDGGGVDVRAVMQSARRFMGSADASMQLIAIVGSLAKELIVLSGVLRFVEVADVAPLPRRVLPRLLAVHGMLCLAAQTAPGAKMSLRGHMQLWQERLPLIYALAHLGDRPIAPNVRETEVIAFAARYPLLGPGLRDVLMMIRDNAQRSVAFTLDDLLRQSGERFRGTVRADGIATLYAVGVFLMRHAVMTPA